MKKKQQLQKRIKQMQKDILRRKANILLEWSSFLYTSEHRCLVTIIADRTFKEINLPISEIDKFKNGANLLKELQEGLVVCMVYKQNKQIEVKINEEFFKMLPVLIQKIKAKVDPTVANLNKLNTNQEIKVCKTCATIRSQKQIQFIGESCNCSIPNFVPIEKDQAKLAKYTLIQGMLKRVQQAQQSIDKLSNQIRLLQKQIDAISNRKLSEYQLFCQKYNLPLRSNLKKTPEMLAEAERYFKQRFAFNSIKRLEEIRANRKRLEQEEAMKKKNKQLHRFISVVRKGQEKQEQGKVGVKKKKEEVKQKELQEGQVSSQDQQHKKQGKQIKVKEDKKENQKQKQQQKNQQKQKVKQSTIIIKLPKIDQGEQQENVKRLRRIDQPYYIKQRIQYYQPITNTLLTPTEQAINQKQLYNQALKEKDKRKQRYIQLFNQLETAFQSQSDPQSEQADQPKPSKSL